MHYIQKKNVVAQWARRLPLTPLIYQTQARILPVAVILFSLYSYTELSETPEPTNCQTASLPIF